MSKNNILVFQHIEQEGLENIKDFFPASKYKFTIIKLFKNQEIPQNLENFSMMIVLGGPMDTWMERDYPWLVNEKNSIRRFVLDLKKPFLGICLGWQLLGEILGARILKSKKTEIGFNKVKSNKIINKDKIFKYLPKEFEVFQWHSYEVNKIKNNNFKVLVSSKTTNVQLFKYKEHAYGMQFHLEIKEDTIEKWCKISSYKKNLEEHLNIKELAMLKKTPKFKFKKIHILCKSFVKNFSDFIKT